MSDSTIAFGRKSRLIGGFFISGDKKNTKDSILRTIIYIDGYNLYYSALTKSKYKWLDLDKLFTHRIIKSINPESEVIQIKFFTSPIKGQFSSDAMSPDRQRKYHNALLATHPNLVEIIQGYHQLKETHAKHIDPANGHEKIRVKILEEKQTDVNIGLHMYRDATLSNIDQLVLVSNDSDLTPAIKMIREDHPHITIGLVLPVLASNKRRSAQLEEYAHWTRGHLIEVELSESQLPNHVQNRKNKTIRKPKEWY
jgi:uncharacterized LabA/DUF88 family protein